mmetsp:Transcript_21468/g.34332  ORF Transcript_21468/g.34332 Transcript_21468/m.34332 type:complete len:261 (+) Transcript_21468:117-899(+)
MMTIVGDKGNQRETMIEMPRTGVRDSTPSLTVFSLPNDSMHVLVCAAKVSMDVEAEESIKLILFGAAFFVSDLALATAGAVFPPGLRPVCLLQFLLLHFYLPTPLAIETFLRSFLPPFLHLFAVAVAIAVAVALAVAVAVAVAVAEAVAFAVVVVEGRLFTPQKLEGLLHLCHLGLKRLLMSSLKHELSEHEVHAPFVTHIFLNQCLHLLESHHARGDACLALLGDFDVGSLLAMVQAAGRLDLPSSAAFLLDDVTQQGL